MKKRRTQTVHLDEAAREYLSLQNESDLHPYFKRHQGKPTEYSYSSVDTYVMTCPLSELVKYINHPSSRMQKLIQSRLSGET